MKLINNFRVLSLSQIGFIALWLAIASTPAKGNYEVTTPEPPTTHCTKINNQTGIASRILLLPKNQNFGSPTVIALFYFVALLYMFLGISIASHIFMCSIEVIVNKTKTVTVVKEEDGVKVHEKRQVKVWNDTIANLTLMALGSSAPEILLSIIETMGNEFCAGSLGPGTIVGSASYNLLIITAVCIVSVPEEEGVRRIKEYKVFLTTSAFAVIAYVWMVIIIQVVSHNKVEIWEAIVTLMLCPTLVGMSYWAELDFCLKGRKEKTQTDVSTIHEPSIPELTGPDATKPLFHFYNEWDDLVDADGGIKHDTVKVLYQKLHEIAVLTDDEIATILATKLIQSKKHSALWYKIRAIQALVGGNKTMPAMNEKLKEVMDVMNDMTRQETGRRGDLRPKQGDTAKVKNKSFIEFSASCMAIPCSVGTFMIVVKRDGREDQTVFAKIQSYDGTAKQNEAYKPVLKNIVFEPYVVEIKIPINVIGDIHKNRDSNFFLKLNLTGENLPDRAALGPMSVMEIVIMDIDNPGEVTFLKKGAVVKDTEKFAEIEIERLEGANGTLEAKWKAVPGPTCTWIETIEGSIMFEHGEMKKTLQVPMTGGHGRAAGDKEQFDVTITEIVGGGSIGKIPMITVAVSADEGFKLQITRVLDFMEEANSDATVPKQTYKEQIRSAYYVNGSVELAKRATRYDTVMHYLSLPWKMILGLVPPPHLMGGWPCFCSALIALGLLTAIVGDMANIFGHALNLDPVTTAITFVALGTSLPDTFASRIAVVQDKTADAAIGNITGSNSVNVFLGLGLPWTIAAIYTHINYPGEVLEVSAQSLAFIVTVYTVVAIIAQFMLWLRRHASSFGYAELGGPTGTRYLTSAVLITCWLFYVSFSIMETQNFLQFQRISRQLAGMLTASGNDQMMVEE